MSLCFFFFQVAGRHLGRCLRTLRDNTAPVRALSVDSHIIVAGAADGTVRLFVFGDLVERVQAAANRRAKQSSKSKTKPPQQREAASLTRLPPSPTVIDASANAAAFSAAIKTPGSASAAAASAAMAAAVVRAEGAVRFQGSKGQRVDRSGRDHKSTKEANFPRSRSKGAKANKSKGIRQSGKGGKGT